MPASNSQRLVDLSRVRVLASTGRARELREAAGLSLREISDALGVASTTVMRWERGERRPHGEAALRYGSVLAALESADVGKP